jgi:hypothetical protein
MRKRVSGRQHKEQVDMVGSAPAEISVNPSLFAMPRRQSRRPDMRDSIMFAFIERTVLESLPKIHL